MFHPFYQKAFSCQSAILFSVPPAVPESLFTSICNPPQCSTRCTRKSFPVSLLSSSVFHPFYQKVFSCQSAILFSVPPAVPESLFLSVCNPLQCSTRCTRKSFPVSLQSSSVFHPLSQKVFSCQSAILFSVPPAVPESLFPSICNHPQCSTRSTRKSFPVSLQSSSVFHPFYQKVFSCQSAILLSVPPVLPESLFLSVCNPPQCSTR